MTKDTTAPERIWVTRYRNDWGRNQRDKGTGSYIGDANDGPCEDDDIEYVRAVALEAAQARIAELERENAILRARATGAVFVCPECDIAGCKHYRAALQEGEG